MGGFIVNFEDLRVRRCGSLSAKRGEDGGGFGVGEGEGEW